MKFAPVKPWQGVMVNASSAVKVLMHRKLRFRVARVVGDRVSVPLEDAMGGWLNVKGR